MRRTWVPVMAAAGAPALSACSSTPVSGAGSAASASHSGPLYRARGYLYYLDYGVDHGAIMRAVVPAGRPRPVVRIGDSAVTGMAVAGGRLYWAAGVSAGQILHVRLQGAPSVRVLVRHLTMPVSLTPADGWLYWVDGAFVGRVRLDGSHLARRFLDLRAFKPLDVAADGRYLFLAGTCGHIGRVDLAGPHFDPSFIRLGPDACPSGLAVGGRYLYWLEGSAAPYYIGRADMAGTRPDGHWLNLHNLGTFDLAADSYDVFFDWQFDNSNGENNKIGRARADGTGLQRYVWLGQGPLALTSPGAGQ